MKQTFLHLKIAFSSFYVFTLVRNKKKEYILVDAQGAL